MNGMAAVNPAELPQDMDVVKRAEALQKAMDDNNVGKLAFSMMLIKEGECSMPLRTMRYLHTSMRPMSAGGRARMSMSMFISMSFSIPVGTCATTHAHAHGAYSGNSAPLLNSNESS